MHDVFFFTDIHGHLKLYNALKEWCLKQDPECTIIYGGDAADRGENGYKIIKDILNTPQMNYLYGNHEDYFVKSADELIGHAAANDELYNKFHTVQNEKEAEQILREAHGFHTNCHIQDSGWATLRDWLIDGADEEIIEKIRVLPRTFTYENLDFCHAGGSYKSFKEINNAEYNKETLNYWTEQKCIWDRDCLALGWETGRIGIFGHTTTIYLPTALYGSPDKSAMHIHPAAWQDHMGAKHMREGWKIDMDTGATWTNRAYVLNCLTMNVYGFCYKELDDKIIELENYNILEKNKI